jgi:hypothetical protein
MEAFVPRKAAAEALPAAPASSPAPSARRALLDANAILGHAQAPSEDE